MANIAAFYSAKLNMAQHNYPVHEIEMLAGIETMLRHKDIMQGVHFKWVTDHKGLVYLLNQKSISGRQARWLEKISSFLFKVVYVPGSKNVVADALSCMYSNDSAGTVRAPSEFVHHDVSDDDMLALSSGMPILAGMEAVVAMRRSSRPRKPCRLGDSDDQPETSTEFARRVVGQFILCGPREQMEGGSTEPRDNEHGSTNIVRADDSSTDVTNRPLLETGIVRAPEMDHLNTSLVEVVLESTARIDLIKELKGHYQEDALFKTILHR